jgi:hypothetical protein
MFARWCQSAPFNNPQIRNVWLNKELLLLKKHTRAESGVYYFSGPIH